MAEVYTPPELQDLGEGSVSPTGLPVGVPISLLVWDVAGAINYGLYINVYIEVNVGNGDEE